MFFGHLEAVVVQTHLPSIIIPLRWQKQEHMNVVKLKIISGYVFDVPFFM